MNFLLSLHGIFIIILSRDYRTIACDVKVPIRLEFVNFHEGLCYAKYFYFNFHDSRVKNCPLKLLYNSLHSIKKHIVALRNALTDIC